VRIQTVSQLKQRHQNVRVSLSTHMAKEDKLLLLEKTKQVDLIRLKQQANKWVRDTEKKTRRAENLAKVQLGAVQKKDEALIIFYKASVIT
jgi:hypothetical protein